MVFTASFGRRVRSLEPADFELSGCEFRDSASAPAILNAAGDNSNLVWTATVRAPPSPCGGCVCWCNENASSLADVGTRVQALCAYSLSVFVSIRARVFHLSSGCPCCLFVGMHGWLRASYNTFCAEWSRIMDFRLCSAALGMTSESVDSAPSSRDKFVRTIYCWTRLTIFWEVASQCYIEIGILMVFGVMRRLQLALHVIFAALC